MTRKAWLSIKLSLSTIEISSDLDQKKKIPFVGPPPPELLEKFHLVQNHRKPDYNVVLP